MTNKTYQLEQLIYQLERQYPLWPSTFGKCSEGCDNMARGSGKCRYCIEKEIAALVGHDKAKKLHQLIDEKHELMLNMFEDVEDD